MLARKHVRCLFTHPHTHSQMFFWADRPYQALSKRHSVISQIAGDAIRVNEEDCARSLASTLLSPGLTVTLPVAMW